MKNLIAFFVLIMLLSGIIVQAQTNEKNTTEKDTKKAVEVFLNAVGEKNPTKIAASVSQDVDWYIFESKVMPWTGHRTKRADIEEVFSTLFTYFVPGKEHVELNGFLVDGNEAAIFGSVSRMVKSTQKSFTVPFSMHIKVENGLISKFFMYEETLILEKAFTR